MQKFIKLILCLLVTVFLYACGFGFDFDFIDINFLPERVAAKADEAVFDVSPGFFPLEPDPIEEIEEAMAFDLYLRIDDYVFQKNEPLSGCYLGAFIEEDNVIDGEIGLFERTSGVNHAVYAYKHTLGEAFPAKFVLQSLARSKVPLVHISPCTDNYEAWYKDYLSSLGEDVKPGFENSFTSEMLLKETDIKERASEKTDSFINYKQIEEIAMEFGAFNVPMFISFNANETGYEKELSKEFYTALRKAFLEHAPQCAFVWSIGEGSVSSLLDHYPGDDMVDWVGLSAFSNILPDGNHSDILKSIDELYFAFQESKPIMITELGVSSFSSTDYSYKVSEASLVMQEIYEKISQRYPRIKAVIYASLTHGERDKMQSYILGDSERMLEAYKVATESERLTSFFDAGQAGNRSVEWLLSQYAAYIFAEKTFISKSSLEKDLKILSRELNSYSGYLELFDSQEYYDSSMISDFGFSITATGRDMSKVFLSRN
jgi:hypothetical protein